MVGFGYRCSVYAHACLLVVLGLNAWAPRGADAFGPCSNCFTWCGNYCGSGWCNGKNLYEDDCDDSAKALGCSDGCCKTHDYCCRVNKKSCHSGSSRGCNAWRQCNQQMVNCLNNCPSGDLCPTHSGTTGYYACGFDHQCSPSGTSTGMSGIIAVGYGCCGGNCPGDFEAGLAIAHQLHNATRTTPSLSKLEVVQLSVYMGHTLPRSTVQGVSLTVERLTAHLVGAFINGTFATGSKALLNRTK